MQLSFILNQNLNQSICYVPVIDLTGVSETKCLGALPFEEASGIKLTQ